MASKALITLTLILVCAVALGASIGMRRSAKLVRVVDGDTIECVIEFASESELGYTLSITMKARLYGINAPDTKDGADKKKISRENLEKLIAKHCKDGLFQAELKGREKYGRVLLVIWAGDVQVNDLQVKDGQAVPYFP